MVFEYSSLIYLVIWIFCWFFGWGGWYFLPRTKRDYIDNYVVVSVYFFIVSLIILFIFQNILTPLQKSVSLIPLGILIFFFVINFLAYFFSNRFLKKPIEFLKKYSNLSYLRLDYRYLISKSFEIFFQQILIISLVFMLNNLGLNIAYITVIFAFLFGFGHIPMMKLQKGFFGIFIFVASILASFFFPFLILNFQYGFVYTYILHWLFYTNTGVLFWIVESKYFEKPMVKVATELQKNLPNLPKSN